MNPIDEQNWHLHTDAEHILWLTFDKKNASANTLDAAVLTELDKILTVAQQTANLKGIVIQSGKTSGFIAGADIEQFTKFENADAAFTLLRLGQGVFSKLEGLSIPTVALIDGFCLGGGLELALACRYRIAEDSRSKLGLPEVMLGIHPAWGGCVRLPKLIGAMAAMGLILAGRTVSAKAAKKMGFVDAALPRRFLVKAAKSYIVNPPKPHCATLWQRLSNNPLVRPLLAKVFRRQLRKKIREAFYPAPFAVVNTWEKNGVEGEQAFIAEAQSVTHLQENATAQNLVRVFFLQDRLKALSKHVVWDAKHLHVIGAGTMGGDIAAWAALKGFRVTLQDPDLTMIAKTIARAYKLFKKKLKDRLLIRAALDRLSADPEGLGVTQADIIIEAVFEDLTVKQNIFKSLEQRAKPSAVLASNTSSIPLDEINQAMQNPERLVGIHFFNPVAKMMLVEVVRGARTDEQVFNYALAFVHKIGKLALPVKSSPGFLVNRVLMPYLMECMALLQDGFAPEVIDAAAVDFGMPMGPVQLADTVGLDICLSVARNLTKHYGGTVPEQLTEMVAAKKLGVKTGQGFYTYKNGKPIKNKNVKSISAAEKILITDRLIYRMLNESAACLREEVVSDGDLLDAGMIFGTGFAPFRGGPMHYAQSVGKEKVLEQFTALRNLFGARFTADAEWNKLS